LCYNDRNGCFRRFWKGACTLTSLGRFAPLLLALAALGHAILAVVKELEVLART
jgi:hypothetical protein